MYLSDFNAENALLPMGVFKDLVQIVKRGGLRMFKSNHWMKSCSYVLIAILFTGMVMGQTFGPYTSDANTVMLMHFDGDLTDEAGTVTGATAEGTVSYSSDPAKFGQALYLDNSGVFPNYQDLVTLYGTDTTSDGLLMADSVYYADAVAFDTSYVMIPSITGLDLSGDFTIEFWLKTVDHQVWSTGANVVSKADSAGNYNFFVTDQGGLFKGGMTEDNSSSDAIGNFGMDVQSDALDPDGTSAEEPYEDVYDWKHITLQHDATNGWIGMATHDTDGTLLSYATHKKLGSDHTKTIEWQQHPGDGALTVTHSDGLPLLIGMGNDKAVHGYIDELRISSTVIEVEDAPAAMISTEKWELQNFMPGTGPDVEIRGFGRIANQDVDVTSYPIRANIVKLGDDAGIASATLSYHTRNYPLTDRIAPDAAGWQTIAMTESAGNIWQADIPQQAFKTVVEYYITATTTDGAVESTIGKDNDWHNQNFGGAGWVVQRGIVDTYFRFVVWKDSSLVLDLNMDDLQTDNVPKDMSEWGTTVTAVGSYTLPDDVPSAIEDNSFSSVYLTSDAPGMLEILDNDHLKSHTWTFSYWFKTEAFDNAFIIANQNGSRWEADDLGYDGRGMGFWQNNPGMDVRGGDVPYIRNYAIRYADTPHPFVPQDVFNVETNKWYQHVCAIEYTGNPGTDSIYTIVKDEDGVLVGMSNFELKNPPALTEGRFRVGHRGGDEVQFYNGYVDDIKMWNYYNTDPELWDYVVGIEDEPQLATTFRLEQNYPNPFNPSTRINYSLETSGEVTLSVYNLLGQEVMVLVNDTQAGGSHVVDFDASGMASGMYLYELKTNDKTAVRKMLLMK